MHYYVFLSDDSLLTYNNLRVSHNVNNDAVSVVAYYHWYDIVLLALEISPWSLFFHESIKSWISGY